MLRSYGSIFFIFFALQQIPGRKPDDAIVSIAPSRRRR
jgi:hypothetical protein